MCYKPIKIYNNSVFYRSDMPKQLSVPCGQCADCQRNQRNEWYLRSMYEYKDIKAVGGMFVFITLTYNNKHLPKFCKRLKYDKYGVPTERDIEIPCFSSIHIRHFIKKLRTYLKREGYDPNGLRYIVCPEYGSKTKRPHYHAGIGLRYSMPVHTLKRLIKKAWIHGYVGVSKKGFVITDLSGMRYIAKYVSKDISFYDNYKLFDYLHEQGVDSLELKERKKELRPFLPYHRQSTFFGYGIAREIQKKHPNNLLDYLVQNDFEVINSASALKPVEHFPIPRYIVNKLTKFMDKITRPSKPLLSRNELGVNLGLASFNKTIESDKMLYDLLSSPAYIDSQVPKSPKRLPNRSDLDYWLDCVNYDVEIEDMKRDFSKLRFLNPVKMSIYSRFLRNLPYKQEYDECDMFDNVYDMKHNQLSPCTIPVENLKKFIPSSIKASRNIATPIKEFPELKEELTFSSMPQYAIYEHLCQLMDKFNRLVSLSRKENYERKINQDESVRFYYCTYNTL